MHWVLAVVLVGVLWPGQGAWAQSTLVAQGKTAYTTGNTLAVGASACSGCHYFVDAPAPDNATQPPAFTVVSNHHQGANNLAFLRAAFVTGGKMVAQSGVTIDAPNAAQQDVYKKLSLYIGQYKAPSFSSAPTMRVASGRLGTRDIFPLLRTDGTSGVGADSTTLVDGLTGGLNITNSLGTAAVATSNNAGSASATQAAGSSGGIATLAYNIQYTSPAQFDGTDTFYVKVANPTGVVTQAVTVTVLGINSAASVRGVKGTTYTAGAGALYKVTSSDASATTFTASGLPTGLAINASTGDITGTPTVTGDFSVTVGATTATATHSTNGAVSKTITISIDGISSASAASYSQGVAISPNYQITAFPGAQAGFYTLSSTPAGMAFNTSTGVLSGTPTTSGVYNLTIGARTVAPAVVADRTQAFTVTVTSAGLPTISTNLPASPTSAGDVNTSFNGSAYRVDVSNPSLTGMVFGASGLPTGLSISTSTGLITGTPSVSGDFPLTLTGRNASGPGTPVALTMRVDPVAVPILSSTPALAALPAVSGNVGAAITPIQINATNAPIIAGSYRATGLPAGLAADANTGVISGSPMQSGDFPVVLFARNRIGEGSSTSVTIRISPNQVPVVTSTPALAAAPAVTGTRGSAITPIQINATNPPIVANGYSAVGLPAGLTVDANTGVINGTPTQSGDFPVVLRAENAAGTGSATSVTIRINPTAVPVIGSAATASTNVNQPFAGYQITASNAPITSYAVVAPSTLPAGLVLNTGTGLISGTPTASGQFTTTLRATNPVGPSADFTLAFTIVPTAMPVVTSALVASPAVTGTVGSAIAPVQITATNPTITGYGAPGLAATGLTINGAGQIVGTPTASGDFPVTLSATNAAGTGNSAQITIRIHPNVVPVIAGGNPVNGTANSVYAGHQIVASNGPILSYEVVAPSTLPPGLTLNTGTGAISGTPTLSGNFQTAVRATNVVGASAPATLALQVDPSTVPAITSPTFASMSAGVAITPIQVVAANAPITGYSASGLPPGLQIDTATGVISGTPGVPGVFSATITATNSIGPGSRVVPFTIGVPAPSACAMSVPLNTPTTLDLASCLFSGFAPTGVTIVATPAHGTVLASGTRVTFTPTNNYFGPDAFSFVGTGAAGTSPQGVVQVTVTGRPDPMRDAAVVAVLNAQAETAQRFSRAQISNFQRRMEALHRRPGATGAPAGALQGTGPMPAAVAAAASASAVTGPQTGFASSALAAGTGTAAGATAQPAGAQQVIAPAPSAAALGSDLALPRTIGRVMLDDAGGGLPGQVGQGAQAAREADVLNAIALGSGLRALPFADSVISLIKSRSVDLASLGSGLGLNTTPDASGNTSYWIEGVASFGTRDASGGTSASEFRSNGISVGVDRRVNKDLALGVGLGYARDRADIGGDGTVNRAKGYSLAVYGSYQLSDKTFLDALLGIGSVDFDTRRFVAPINDFAYGSRAGTQVFGSLTGGYELRDRDLLISPYGRLDFSSDRLRSGTETGAGAFALTYFGQTNTSVQGTLGVRAESVHATSFGYAVPRVRAELRHEFKGTGTAFVGYADQPGGPRYALAAAGGSRNTMVLGIGGDFLMRDGLVLALEYQLSHSFARDSSHALRLRLSKDFDARGMPKLRLAEPDGDDEPLNLQFDAGVTYDSNVTRAKSGPDRLGDDSYSFNMGKTWSFDLSGQSRVQLTGTLGGEKFRRYNGLSRAAAGLEAEYQYRASSEFDEPTLGAFARITGEAFESALRDGHRVSLGLTLRQPLTDRIGLFGAVSHNQRFARSGVFETRDNSVRANIDYALSNNQTLYLSGEFRRGDVVSTARPSLENVSIAKVLAQDDAFPGGGLFAYRVQADTVLATFGYNLSFGPKDSLDLSWRHIRSTPGLRPAFVTSPRSYKANQWSAVYLLRF